MRVLAPVLAAALALGSAAPAQAAVVPVEPGGPAGSVDVLVTLDPRVPDVAAAARAATPAGGTVRGTWSHVLKGYGATLPAAAVAALERAPGVVRVERDPVLRASAVQPSPPEGLDRIDQRTQPLNRSYTFTRTGAGVTAYVVDTGIRTTHSDFTGRARSGFDAIDPGGAALDCDGHGTHVAGTVGGARFGVAKQVTLSAVRVLDCNGAGTGTDLLEGLDFIVRTHAAGAPAVAVLSLGGDTTSDTIDQAVRAVVADGVSVSVAAGNSSADACLTSPARVPEVLTVGATSPFTDRRASFSNHGECLDLFAPGVDVTSAGYTSDTEVLVASGTSMAAPHVAGAAALVLEETPTASPSAVQQTIKERATQGVVLDPLTTSDDLLFTGEPQPVLAAPSPSPSPSPSASPTPSPSASPSPTPTASPSAAPLLPDLPQSTEEVRGRFTALQPARVLDTRDGTGGATGRLDPGEVLVLDVTGAGGVPPTGVTAVALNVTVTGAVARGHLTAYPADRARPGVSNLNHSASQTVANLVVTGVDDAGRVALVSSSGFPHVVADVVGYYSDTLGGVLSSPLRPERLVDTRSGVGALNGRLPAGEPVSFLVSGRKGVPAEGVSAAVLNVTAIDAKGVGHLTAFAGGRTVPRASNLNYAPGQTVPNLVLAEVGPDGRVQLQASGGAPHVAVDVVGYYGEAGSNRFVPVAPERLLDTRRSGTRLAPGEAIDVPVGGRASLPGLGVTSVVVNVTAVDAAGAGHLTVFPADAPLPGSSNVNYRAGQTVPNLVFSATTPESGTVRIRSSAGSPHVLVDVVGYTTANASSS